MARLITFIVFLPVLIAILLIANFLLADHKPDAEKVETYESGFYSVGDARSTFNIIFFLVALLFMIFDIEVLLYTPIVVSLITVGGYGFVLAVLFFTLLTIGFIYEIGKGAIDTKKVSYLTNM